MRGSLRAPRHLPQRMTLCVRRPCLAEQKTGLSLRPGRYFVRHRTRTLDFLHSRPKPLAPPDRYRSWSFVHCRSLSLVRSRLRPMPPLAHYPGQMIQLLVTLGIDLRTELFENRSPGYPLFPARLRPALQPT